LLKIFHMTTNQTCDIQDILMKQNVELEFRIGKKLQQIKQEVLTTMQNAQEHLFSEESEFLTEEETNEILVESIKTKQELIEKLEKVFMNFI